LLAFAVATPKANADLPMAGRAATRIICAGISFMRLSSSVNPVTRGHGTGHSQAVQVRVQVVAEPAERAVIVLVGVGDELFQLRLVGGDRLRH
jgi:hypothetical protein